MSNYVKATDFASKDALTTGDPLKIIKGTEINTEFNNIQTAIATKADLASPAFTGNPTATTQATNNSSTRLATTAFVNNQIAANEASVSITGGTIDGVAITGGTITGLATDLAVADGGTGASSFTLNSVVLGNNTSALNGNMVAPGTSGNVLTSNGTTWQSSTNPRLGVNQLYQDVTGSRALNTEYTNNTGLPIFISVVVGTLNTTSAQLQIESSVGSGSFIIIGDDVSTIGSFTNFTAIIPNGLKYKVTTVNSPVLIRWIELR